MAQSDLIAQVASLTAEVKDWQDKAAAATDTSAKAIAAMMASNAETKLQTALQQLQHQVDSTNTFLDNMQLWGTINQITSGLGSSLPTIIGIFKK